VPPKWIIEPEDTAVLDNQLTIINCQAEGYPEPRITWTRVSGLLLSCIFWSILKLSTIFMYR